MTTILMHQIIDNEIAIKTYCHEEMMRENCIAQCASCHQNKPHIVSTPKYLDPHFFTFDMTCILPRVTNRSFVFVESHVISLVNPRGSSNASSATLKKSITTSVSFKAPGVSRIVNQIHIVTKFLIEKIFSSRPGLNNNSNTTCAVLCHWA
jgi:hypothetical protein